MRRLIKILLCISTGFSGLSAMAFEIQSEFSAEAVQSIPGRAPVIAKMFVSKNAVRTESNSVIEIVYPQKNKRLLLNQLKKTWFEQKMPANKPAQQFSKNKTPCDTFANATCKNLGKETINGRKSIKWEMSIYRNNRTMKSLHWIDIKYHIPLREQYPDGTISTMTLIGKEKINGRSTEKWKFQTTRPNGQQAESHQWYDLKLRMVIREELPGGYVRELRKIKVSKQDKNLFKIPSGYKKITMHAIQPANKR